MYIYIYLYYIVLYYIILYIHILYIHIYTCVYTCVYIYIYPSISQRTKPKTQPTPPAIKSTEPTARRRQAAKTVKGDRKSHLTVKLASVSGASETL